MSFDGYMTVLPKIVGRLNTAEQITVELSEETPDSPIFDPI